MVVAGNAQATMNINIKPQPGEIPSSEEIDKPMNQQDPGTVSTIVFLFWSLDGQPHMNKGRHKKV